MADVFEDEAEQPTVTIDEYLQGIEDQELEADLVLGGDQGKECTYSKGYMKRQAIFSCLTCTPDGNAGVCTACSLSCHEGHEILELWTKRNFRCDCGNSKFGEFFCKLASNKDIENADNSYNHNFKGSYCTCDRPYPDPEAEEQVEMMQCCICEDWFHEEHIGLESPDEIPRDEDGEPMYEDFICQACSLICSFLTLYPQAIWAVGKQHDTTVDDVKNKGTFEDPSSCETSQTMEDNISGKSKIDNEKANDISVSLSTGIDYLPDPKATGNDMGSTHGTTDASPITACMLGVDLMETAPSLESKPMFLSRNWRDILCRCEKCAAFYVHKCVGFLLVKEDSIEEYEKVARQKREENLQQEEGVEFNFLNKLEHVAKIEIMNGIAEMKNEFHSFLESFDTSKPVTTADVRQVFENLTKKRRRDM